MDATTLFKRSSQLLPFGMALLGVVLIGHMVQLSLLDYQLNKGSNLAKATQASPSSPDSIDSSDNNISTFSIENLLSKHLMGEAKPDIRPEVVQLPETRLKLVLVGTFTDSQQEDASALIAEQGRSAQLFYIGDQIQEDAQLSAIEKHAVTLKRNDKYEVLYFPYHTGHNQYEDRRQRHHRQRQNTVPTNSHSSTQSQVLSLKQRLEKLKKQRQENAKQ